MLFHAQLFISKFVIAKKKEEKILWYQLFEGDN